MAHFIEENKTSIEDLIQNYTRTLIQEYLKEEVLNNPAILSRIQKIVFNELKRIIKISIL